MKLRRGLWLLLLFAIVLVLDMGSKHYVNSYIPLMSRLFPFYPYGGIGLFHNFFGIEFSIIHVINKGAAWGMLASWQLWLLLARMAVVIGMAFYIMTSEGWLAVPLKKDSFLGRRFGFLSVARPFFKQIPLTLVVVGAVGNVIDYFIYGHVIDMFHFRFGSYTYPIFNVADCAIFCGIVWLLVQSWQEKYEFSKN